MSRIEVSRPGGGGPFEPLTEWGLEHSPTLRAGRALRGVGARQRRRAQRAAAARARRGRRRRCRSPRDDSRASPPTATWIVFSAPLQREWRIWRVRPDGSGRAPIGASQRSEGRPTLSPDGRFVAYVASEAPPRRHLYLRRFDGSGDRILFADGDGENPVW